FLQDFGSCKIRIALREIDRAVLHRKASHLADHGLGELSCLGGDRFLKHQELTTGGCAVPKREASVSTISATGDCFAIDALSFSPKTSSAASRDEIRNSSVSTLYGCAAHTAATF